jgi:uncharacterized protein (UPF0332 family)
MISREAGSPFTGSSDRRGSQRERDLKETFDLRQESDYQPIVRLTDEKAQEVLGWATEFVAVCRKLCE